MSPEERRRQFIGIGLRKFVERPLLEVSLEEVAEEAGVSSGLLFHYFATKVDFHRAVIEAAGRRVMRNIAPDEGASEAEAVHQIAEHLIDQIARRRDSYLALVYGRANWAPAGDDGAALRLRQELTTLVQQRAGLRDADLPVIHAWVAYVEDRALQWSSVENPTGRDALVEHCAKALPALIELSG